MDITAKQLERILEQVVADALDRKLKPLEDKMVGLTGATAELSATIQSYLRQEWQVHIHATHPRLEGRLARLERKVGLKTE